MLLLHNANIRRLNAEKSRAEAILVEQWADASGRVVAVGDSEKLIQEFGHKAKMEDMGGRTILPGLTDAHIHFRHYALSFKLLDVDCKSREECLARVAKRAESSEAGKWIVGHGWRQNEWAEGFGDAQLLDEAAPNNPVYLTAASLHAGWANSAALKAAGINKNSADPPKGKIQRQEDGQASGILFEGAMKLVSSKIPQVGREESILAMQEAQAALWKMGLTGIHDFDRIRSFEALQIMRERGDLGLRVLKNLPVEKLDQIIEIGLRSGFGDDLLRIGNIKAFADGALGPRTAAMIDPYEGEADNRGMLLMDGEEIFEWGQKAAKGGLGMTVHAIGDRANHEVLNALEQLRNFEREHNLPARRHRIEHVQVLHANDFGRLAKLKIAASVQPIHAPADREASEKFWGARTKNAYAWKSLLQAGSLLAFGSDAPVESPNPFGGIHAAVSRRDKAGLPGEDGWYPKQRLSLDEALAGFTSGPAYLGGWEAKLGQLSPGFLADLIVVEDDPFSIEAMELHKVKVSSTMLGGEWFWRE